MKLLVSGLSLSFYVGVWYLLGRAKLRVTPKLTLLVGSLGIPISIGLENVYLLFTTMGMVFFMCLWLSSIGVLTPQHTVKYGIRLLRVKLITYLLELLMADADRIKQGDTESNEENKNDALRL